MASYDHDALRRVRSWQTHMKIALSVNSNLIDKPSDTDKKAHSALGWQSRHMYLEEWQSTVASGFAYAPQYKNGHRKGSNFECAGFLAVDFDGGVTLFEARDNPFVNAYAAFTYTTASHTDDHHRFRLNFVLEEPITDAQHFADANLALAVQLGADTSIADKARCFFGNTKAEIWTLGRLLPRELVAELVQAGHEYRTAYANNSPVDAVKPVASDLVVKTAVGELVPLHDLPTRTAIHCEMHDDRRPSAFVVRSNNGQSVGFHCRRCRGTFWSVRDEYDFSKFDAYVLEQQHKPTVREKGTSIFDEFFPPEPNYIITQERFLSAFRYKRGVTLVKSPKGTGKTIAVKRLIDEVRFQKPKGKAGKGWPKKVLVIGHRRALLREMASKLGVTFYLEHGDGHGPNPDSLAVCLDSLPAYTEPYVDRWEGRRRFYKRDPAFDLVIIDESEQVFSHLIGETITKKQGALDRCYDALMYQISQAKAVVALDADLGMLTAHVMKYGRPQDWQSARIVYNKPVPPAGGRVLQLYQSEVALREELIGAIERGERCFVTSNSKKAVNVLHKIIAERSGKGVKIKVVTSDNSRDSSEIEFVNNITAEFLKLQVIICSPSLGTGIDITYPDPTGGSPSGLCKVDHVFGFFYPKVNTHTDMDQQLWRVRNPGSVKVWISPVRFQFSSSFDVIRDDLARARYVPRAVQGNDKDGLTKYDPFNPLLMIYTHVTAAQRASKNKLIDLFCELRESQGWEIEHIDTRVPKNRDRSEAERKLWNEQAKGLLAASNVDDDEFLDLSIRLDKGDPLTIGERLIYARNKLQRSLGVALTYDIIKLNHDDRLVERIEVLSSILKQWSFLCLICKPLLAEQGLPLARIPKVNPIVLVSLAMIVAGIADENGLQSSAVILAANLGPFADICVRNRTNIERLLGQKVRDDVATNPVRQLNIFLRLAGLKLIPIRRSKQAGQTKRGYGLDQQTLPLMFSLAQAFRPPEEVVEELSRLRRENG